MCRHSKGSARHYRPVGHAAVPQGGGGELPPEGAGRERGQPQRALPAAFDGTRVDAKYVDGILTLTLPKPEAAKPRRVQVQTS